jgi:threonine dehydrogenase-like Zn-dependent dehydrogenase
VSNPFHVAEASPGPRRVAVLGAGPVGLEVALAARERGARVRVYEAAPSPAGNVRRWGHVRLFTPWGMVVSERMERALEEAGAPVPGRAGAASGEPGECPTGHRYADRVLDPLWALFSRDEELLTGTRVVAVGREGTLKHEEIGTPERGGRPFRILVADGSGAERIEHADLVLDCTGKHGHPNALGDGGIPAPGERTLGREGDRIVRTIPDLAREADAWADRTILLVGAGHSAQTAVRDLAALASSRPGTKVLWAVRSDAPDWGAVEDDPLPERKALTEAAAALAGGASPAVELLAGVAIERLDAEGRGVAVRLRRGGRGGADAASGAGSTVRVDRILGLTGGVGDHGIYRQLQVHECYATSGPMKLAAALLGSGSADCLDQESHGVDTLRNPEPGFYLLGDKSYGRNNTFLLRNGWTQVDEVFAAEVEAAAGAGTGDDPSQAPAPAPSQASGPAPSQASGPAPAPPGGDAA